MKDWQVKKLQGEIEKDKVDMKLLRELIDYFKEQDLRDEEHRKEFFRKWATAELIEEWEAAANES